MQYVLTLIADPAAPALNDTLAAKAAAAIQPIAGRTGATDWLAPGLACDISFDSTDDTSGTERSVRAALNGAPVDIVVQPAAGRRKTLLLADMESTIIENELVDDLADMIGAGEQVGEITRQAMNGEILFRPALRQRTALLANLDVSYLEKAKTGIRFAPGADTLVRTMRANGAYTVLVSGGFRVFTSYVRDEIGFDRDLANDLEIVDGHLTGQVVEPILGREAKLDALTELTRERGFSPSDSLAVGDGFNDVLMIEAAGLGVAYRAKPAVADVADARIEYSDFSALLYLQGYRQADIVA